MERQSYWSQYCTSNPRKIYAATFVFLCLSIALAAWGAYGMQRCEENMDPPLPHASGNDTPKDCPKTSYLAMLVVGCMFSVVALANVVYMIVISTRAKPAEDASTCPDPNVAHPDLSTASKSIMFTHAVKDIKGKGASCVEPASIKIHCDATGMAQQDTAAAKACRRAVFLDQVNAAKMSIGHHGMPLVIVGLVDDYKSSKKVLSLQDLSGSSGSSSFESSSQGGGSSSSAGSNLRGSSSFGSSSSGGSSSSSGGSSSSSSCNSLDKDKSASSSFARSASLDSALRVPRHTECNWRNPVLGADVVLEVQGGALPAIAEAPQSLEFGRPSCEQPSPSAVVFDLMHDDLPPVTAAAAPMVPKDVRFGPVPNMSKVNLKQFHPKK